jgi:hypothetical protein
MLRKVTFLGLVLLGDVLVRTSVAAPGNSFFAEEPPPVAGAPFSGVAKTQSTTVFSGGTRIVRGNSVRFFRDSQGRTRTERGLGVDGTHAPTMIVIDDAVAGVRYFVSPALKVAQEVPLHGENIPEPAQASSSELDSSFALLGFGMGVGANPQTESSADETTLGQKTINGVNATGTRLVRTIPAGVLGNDRPITSTLERWVSTDLNVPVTIDQKSSIGGELTLSLGQITRAEPDPSLFAPPAGYKVHQFPSVARSAAQK